MAGTSRVEIVVEKAQGRMPVRLSRLRVRSRPRQEDPFRDLDGLIWGHDAFLAPINCTSTGDRHVIRQRECKYSEEHSLRF